MILLPVIVVVQLMVESLVQLKVRSVTAVQGKIISPNAASLKMSVKSQILMKWNQAPYKYRLRQATALTGTIQCTYLTHLLMVAQRRLKYFRTSLNV